MSVVIPDEALRAASATCYGRGQHRGWKDPLGRFVADGAGVAPARSRHVVLCWRQRIAKENDLETMSLGASP